MESFDNSRRLEAWLPAWTTQEARDQKAAHLEGMDFGLHTPPSPPSNTPKTPIVSQSILERLGKIFF